MSGTVVCGVDRSRQSRAAARLASALARRLGLWLELVHVTPRGERDVDAARWLHAEFRRTLDQPDVSMRLESGPVDERLAAIARGAELLVVGTRGDGALRRALMGSVSAALTRRPPAPVVVVPSGAVDPGVALLAEGGVVCGVRDRHDVSAAEAAAALAGGLGLRLTLVHVLSPPRMPVSAAGGAPPARLLPRVADDAAAAVEMLDAIARSVRLNTGASAQLKVLEGPVGPQLAQVAATENAALIALGASDRGALAAALAGSPSLHVLRRSARPLMVCPPHVRIAT